MKNHQVFIILSVFVIAFCAAVDHFVKSAIPVNNDAEFDESKISSGTQEKKRDNQEMCYMNVTYQQQWQLCGCTLIENQWIVTAKTCVFDFLEGEASHANITFPQAKRKERINTFSAIFMHETDNIAVLKLTIPMTVDNRRVRIANVATDTTKDVYVGQTVVSCGIGSTENYPTYPRRVRCTNLTVTPIDTCQGITTNTFCIDNTDDANICNGDYGGPIYINTYERRGRIASQLVIGLSSYSPDYNEDAPCKDSHKVVCLQLANYIDWWKGIISANP